MKLSRPIKLLVGAATLWLPLYMIAFFVIVFTGAFPTEDGFNMLFRVHMATSIASVGLLAFYVLHLFKAKHLVGDQRVMWALAIFFLGPFAMPVYFANHVWPEVN